jgi:hypothetical protein
MKPGTTAGFIPLNGGQLFNFDGKLVLLPA